MPLDPNTVATIALAGAGAAATSLIWAMNQSARIDRHDTVLEEREKQANERHSEIKAELSEIKQLIRGQK